MSNLIRRAICPRCNEAFEAVNEQHTYCSSKCKKAIANKRKRLGETQPIYSNIRYVDCPVCLKPFATTLIQQKYCSATCNNRAKSARARGMTAYDYMHEPTPIWIVQCIGCQTLFTSRRADKRYCDASCKEWLKRQQRRDKEAEWENQRKGSLKARVYMQSNGRCGICNEHIDSRLTYPDSMSMSIDHIIPRSQGGSHKINNLQAAHFMCNAKRGDKPAT